MHNLLAQIKLAPDGGYKGFGILGLDDPSATPGVAPLIFSEFISSTIGLFTIIGVIWFVFVLITGAFGFMTAGGDKQAVEASKKKIMNGLIGLFLLLFAVFAVDLFANLLDLPDLLDPAKFIYGLI